MKKKEEFTPQMLKDAIKQAKKPIKDLVCPIAVINGKQFYLLKISDEWKPVKLALFAFLFFLCGCAGTKQPIVFERPKVSVVYPSYQASPWQSLSEVTNLPTLVYFQFQGAYNYKVAYLTPFGKIPFLQKEIPSGRTNDFWPSVLTDFEYEGDPSRLVFIAKDTIHAAPCYLKAQAWDGEKWSEWSELVKVE